MRPVRTSSAVVAVIALVLASAALPTVASAAPAVAGRYIVTTTPGAAVSQRTTDRLGPAVTARYHRVLDGFAATLTAAQVRALRADPAVESVVPDGVVSLADEPAASRTAPRPGAPRPATSRPAGAVPITWGQDRIDQHPLAADGAYRHDSTGRGVTTYVLDTGVRLSHHELTGRVRSGHDFVDDDEDSSDCHGHGTHVAGTVAGQHHGVAPQADVVAVRVFDCSGSGSWSGFIAALDYVVEDHGSTPAVVNFSGSGGAYDLADTAVARAVDAGVTVVIAAGNEGGLACDRSPGRAPAAITVAATDDQDHQAGFSNYGSCVDLYAPGVDVLSSWWGSDDDTAVLSGTSMATPHVTGAVARMLQDRSAVAPTAVAAELAAAATKDAVLDATTGTPNRLLYVDPTRTSAPTKLRLSKDDPKKRVTARWAPPTRTGGSVIIGYRLTRTGTDAKGRTSVTVDVAGTARSHTFGSLRAGTRYPVSVSALTAIGVGPVVSSSIALTALPGRPVIKKGSSGSTKDEVVSVTGRWAAPAKGGAPTGYLVVAKRVSNQKSTTVRVGAGKRSAVIKGLTKNKAYVVRVYADNAAGHGRASAWSGRLTAR